LTLHELDEAIAAGHRDLESVKRFTGFGTGYCQGKQCVALCARMLATRGGEAAAMPITPRPPFHPIAVHKLAALVEDEDEDDRRPR
jgi:hypothetical protein